MIGIILKGEQLYAKGYIEVQKDVKSSNSIILYKLIEGVYSIWKDEA